MTGVEILNSEQIYNTILPLWCLPVGFISIFVCLLGILACFGTDRIAMGIVCFVLMACSMVAAILGGTDNKHSVNHIEYKVTIDESVSMTEFMDKYEIIDQEGKIYTVKEKD